MNYAEEKRIRPVSGFAGLAVFIAILLVSCLAIISVCVIDDVDDEVFGIILAISIILICLDCILPAGLKIVNPNEALVLSLFGRYKGTIYEPGFYFVNPFSMAIYPKANDQEMRQKAFAATMAKLSSNEGMEFPGKKVSTKLSTFVNGNQKVNDAMGNPVEVSAIVIWKVVNATRAVINVDNYLEYLSNQTDSTIRNIARLYPYDIISDDDGEAAGELTLRGSATRIAEEMREELQKRVEDAGIVIEDVRLNQIAYAPEIAAAMLQRQQATAIIAARRKIVEGAVSMVEMALDRLKSDDVIDFDEEHKAQMVSNLMVVLCSNKETSPIVNAGSIY